MRPRLFSLCLALLLSLFAALPASRAAQAAELVMVEQPGCHWCERWNEEIGPVYGKTVESTRAPLRRVRISALPEDIVFATEPVYTPTFVLVEKGKELGRIEGYPGEDFFWPILGNLLDAFPDATRPGS